MRSRYKRQLIEGMPDWSPLQGKSIKRVNARRFKNREATEKCIFDTLSTIARRGGIQSLGINELAREAKVSKELIYRYFGGLQGLIALYVKKMLPSFALEPELTMPKNPTLDDIRYVVKQIYRIRSELFYKNIDLRVLAREWVFNIDDPKLVSVMRRRPSSIMLKNALSTIKHITVEEIDLFDALIVAVHTGLLYHMDRSIKLNDIDLSSEADRERAHKEIDRIIDDWINRHAAAEHAGKGDAQSTIGAVAGE